MYERDSFYRKGKYKKRKIRKLAAAFVILSGISGVFLLLVLKTLAAPENPEVEAMMEIQAEITGEIIDEEEINSIARLPERIPGKPLIFVDAGHGGLDEGCSAGAVLEKDINLEIAKLLETKLTEIGYQVIMARGDDTYIAKEQRVEQANGCQADLYISIHQNTFDESDVCGIETWYYGEDETKDSKRLAQLIHMQTIKSTGAVERELKGDSDFHVNTQAQMPSCLIETGFISNPEECSLLNTPEYREQIAAGIAEGIDLYFHPKTMYLTFDDGPSAENTAAVLDILKERNIKAAFFVVGENVRKNPEVAKRIVAEGHTIGIHCNRHEYDEIYQSVESYVQDFQEAYDAVLEVTGVEAKLFRFPGGSLNSYNAAISSEIIQEMTDRGYIYFDWNASLEDAVCKSEPEDLIINARESTLDRKKVVLLAHDIIYNTVLCLEDLIEQLPEYKMELLTPDVEAIHFKTPSE